MDNRHLGWRFCCCGSYLGLGGSGFGRPVLEVRFGRECGPRLCNGRGDHYGQIEEEGGGGGEGRGPMRGELGEMGFCEVH